MDKLEKAYYESRFENAFLRAKGNAFQDLFNQLMGRAHRGDYMACRPWGNRGDRKNDGFLKSESRLFQVYAPNEMKEKEAIGKIEEDFNGARAFWGKHFNKWTFVHNAHDGIPPHVQLKIFELEKSNPGIKLHLWGFEELRKIFRRLDKQDLESWFGSAPSGETKAKIGFEEIRVVLEAIGSRKPEAGLPAKEVPPKKIEANQLSDGIATLIKEGMSKASLVDAFFKKWHDPTFGERIAVSFREQYENLRGQQTPNEIFYKF